MDKLKILLDGLETIQSAVARLIGFTQALYDESQKNPANGVNYAVLQLNNQEKAKNEIFTKKEISQMPKLKDLSYQYRKDGVHQFRYRRNGINKSFCSAKLSVAKQKALEFIRELNAQEKEFGEKKFVDFKDFADYYITSVKKTIISEISYSKMFARYKSHILPYFGKKSLTSIKAPEIQSFLNAFAEQKKQYRTAEELFFILKGIFQYAVDTDILAKNPTNAVKIKKHREKVGKALTIEDEKVLLNNIQDTVYKTRIIVMLYTGCRPCELSSAKLEKDGFITFQNRKRKNGAIEFKDIPITPKLAPYMEDVKKELPFTYPDRMKKTLSEKIGNYRVYDLRHTFATRCQECGVPQEIVGRWLGHSSGKITDSVYTHFSDSFMLEQAKKVDY